MKDQKENIQNIALKLFAENGFDGTSIRNIATEANVNIAMISYYFKSKEGLFESVLDDIIVRERNFLTKIDKEALTAYEKILKIVNYNIGEIIDNYHAAKVLTVEKLLYKRKHINTKIESLNQYTNGYLKSLILQHNNKISVTKAELIPLMIHTLAFEIVSNHNSINVITKGDRSDLSIPETREKVKTELMEFMTETLSTIIT